MLPLAVVACTKKTPGSAVRPQEMTANEAMGNASPDGEVKCSASDDDKTLIVDLDGTDRKSIEEMINVKKSVPVVAYDCKSLKVLPSCKLEADFDYIGTASREQVISLENFDKVSADIPLASASLKASVQGGRKMAIALVEVGSHNSKLELVARPQLTGTRKGDCEGATHFIYRVDLGAFEAVVRPARAGARDVDELSGAAEMGEAATRLRLAGDDRGLARC